ncbi:MAG: hypothetical protein HUJ68_02230 [Clostridia bacterium]|nr:hypothetical protein [Clostridia bacterium]
MNKVLESGMNHYLEVLIPKYYDGEKEFSRERYEIPLGVHMQGKYPFHEMRGTDDLIFNFYFLIEHKKQSVQVIRFKSFIIKGSLYEYWVVNFSDHGTPYNYSYFYLTVAENKKSPRQILDISTQYKDSILINGETEVDMEVPNLISLYQATPELCLESYKNTRYENMIVKWKKKLRILEK